MFRDTYNVICILIFEGLMSNQKVEPVRLEANHIQNHLITLYQGTYLQIPSRGMSAPFFLSVAHNDFSALGVEIYLSRKNKFPYKEDYDEVYLAAGSAGKHENDMLVFNFHLQHFGENTFSNDSFYLGIYQYSHMKMPVNLSIAGSFKVPTCQKMIHSSVINKVHKPL